MPSVKTTYPLVGKNELFAFLDDMEEKIEKGDLNARRAESFKNFVIERVHTGLLDLDAISEATAVLSPEGDHEPIAASGYLLEKMIVESHKKGDAIVGYKKGGPKYPGSKLTVHQIAVLQHTGFRIPLSGEKGKRVRKWLAIHGIYPRANKEFLEVKPRPFLFKAAVRFVDSGIDKEIIEQFIKEL